MWLNRFLPYKNPHELEFGAQEQMLGSQNWKKSQHYQPRIGLEFKGEIEWRQQSDNTARKCYFLNHFFQRARIHKEPFPNDSENSVNEIWRHLFNG
jgi:hypothetical protein